MTTLPPVSATEQIVLTPGMLAPAGRGSLLPRIPSPGEQILLPETANMDTHFIRSLWCAGDWPGINNPAVNQNLQLMIFYCITLVTKSGDYLVRQAPMMSLMNANNQQWTAEAQSWKRPLWVFAPGSLIDPRQSFVELVQPINVLGPYGLTFNVDYW